MSTRSLAAVLAAAAMSWATVALAKPAAGPADDEAPAQPAQPAPTQQPPAPPENPGAPPPEDTQPSTQAPVQQAPQQPPAAQPAPQQAEPAPQQPPANGQWVYTAQYGWVWMPYAQSYTYIPPEGVPQMYVYYPAFGWRWVVAPWIFGWGPRPYWGYWGPRYYVWYARPWFRVPPRAYYHRWYRPYQPYRGPARGGYHPAAPSGHFGRHHR